MSLILYIVDKPNKTKGQFWATVLLEGAFWCTAFCLPIPPNSVLRLKRSWIEEIARYHSTVAARGTQSNWTNNKLPQGVLMKKTKFI